MPNSISGWIGRNKLGFEYYLVDDGWKRWKADGKDDWACLREVCDYAKTNGVKIWAWVDCKDVPTAAKRTNFLDRAVAAGVAGVKIDFEPEANVRWVNWYDETLRDAAARKLMINFHGANKPIGRERTWPNEMTRESIRGHEYHILRYNRTLPPQHDCILPFTRFVIGPGDYTPTVFNPKELRGYTWAHELAQAVVFTSPYLCYADHPAKLSEQPRRRRVEGDSLDVGRNGGSAGQRNRQMRRLRPPQRKAMVHWRPQWRRSHDAGLGAEFSRPRQISNDSTGRRAGSR